MKYEKLYMFVTVLMQVLRTKTVAGEENAPSCAAKLVPCASYLNSTNPPASCCIPFKEVMDHDLQCVCNLYDSPGLFESLGINITQVLELTMKCTDIVHLTACRTVSSPATDGSFPDHPKKRRLWLTVGAPVVFLTILTLVSVLSYLRWRSCNFEGKVESNQDVFIQETELLLYNDGTSVTAIDELEGAHKLELRGKKGHELLLFKFSSIEIATDHFSDANKLGQGGFGPVYKGKLVQGQEIAVKRLSRNSGQGLEEFKNEIVLISKLQHRNLVRILGCCIQGEERILIYEYLPNKSLDSFLFDATKRVVLDWKKRICIIDGIAQGLLYLHKYSRLRIIHRDLKTSNILLDNEMNPKISDFGTARIFRENESQASTNRIVGTYGYMSPEYAMDGSFSVKSDVFSFGVMMLEIISGKKNSGFFQPNRPLNLLGHAWDLYREGRGLELMDLAIEETCSRNEFMRCVQVGLLCVQESAVDRPTMSDVVSMLNNESRILPAPKQPAFSNIVGTSVNVANSPENLIPCSINDVTITEMEAR